MLRSHFHLIVSLLLLLPFLFPIHVAAASPSASFSLSPDRRYVYLNFGNLRNVSRVNYVLTYASGSTTKGFEGGIKPLSRTTRASRRQILGSCSTRRCVYHASPRGFELQATFTLRTGGSISLTRTLP